MRWSCGADLYVREFCEAPLGLCCCPSFDSVPSFAISKSLSLFPVLFLGFVVTVRLAGPQTRAHICPLPPPRDPRLGPRSHAELPVPARPLMCSMHQACDLPVESPALPISSALKLAYCVCVQSQPVTPATLLLREACYRAVGEGFAHVSQHIDFTAWYVSELQGLLQGLLRGLQDKSAGCPVSRSPCLSLCLQPQCSICSPPPLAQHPLPSLQTYASTTCFPVLASFFFCSPLPYGRPLPL